ncbi:delta-1-pyrroline-5-carboxylate dehydrogenase mitochondrial-like [Nannochloropsis oceanica]
MISFGRRQLLLPLLRPSRSTSSLRCLAPRLAPYSLFSSSSFSSKSSSTSKALDAFATVDPEDLSGKKPYQVYNLVNGGWTLPKRSVVMPDPLNGQPFLQLPDTTTDELRPYIDSMKSVPKSGLHNPFKNPSRYLLYGDISAKAAQALRDPAVEHFFARLIQRVAPKHYAQAKAEVTISRVFLENFSGDQVRFLARSFGVPGDHTGQVSNGYRFPYGPVAIVSPFNFPLEIPLLQIMGALGSSRVAERLVNLLHGKVKIEDAGFDWKVLGPDVADEDYVAWQCDQDAYAYSGQKCSAQSILFAHENWHVAGLPDKLRQLALRRSLKDFTLGPVLSVTTPRFESHVESILTTIPGAKVMWGGKRLEKAAMAPHAIPECYGAWEPTAIYVPLAEMLASEEAFALTTTEIFGPFYIYTTYKQEELPLVLQALERMENHLTAAVVSNDVLFVQSMVGSTVNGTTYVGRRARTTGAPQNHWFGPSGDPRGAGIGTPEAIKAVWSAHREVVTDQGPVPEGWKTPEAT